MMDAAALKMVLDKTTLAHEKRFFTPPPGTEPPNVYYTAEPDGTVRRIDGVQLPAHKSNDIDTLVRLAASKSGSTLWYSRIEVLAKFPDGGFANFVLNDSDPFSELVRWSNNGTQSFAQKDLWKLFRTTFRDALAGQWAPTMDAIKRVDVKQEQQSVGSVSRTAVSMGKSITSTVAGPELPEELVLYVPIFENLPLRMTAMIRVALELDPSRGVFELTVLPGEIENAYQMAEASVCKLVVAAQSDNDCAGIPLYYGQPG